MTAGPWPPGSVGAATCFTSTELQTGIVSGFFGGLLVGFAAAMTVAAFCVIAARWRCPSAPVVGS